MADIQSALLYGRSNARCESLDTTLQRLSRMAYGFHSPMPLIAFAMLEHGGP